MYIVCARIAGNRRTDCVGSSVKPGLKIILNNVFPCAVLPFNVETIKT